MNDKMIQIPLDFTEEPRLQDHEATKLAIEEACKASSVMRGVSDVAAAGGIMFEIHLCKEINKRRSEDFPFWAYLNKDLETAHGINPMQKSNMVWGELISYENYKKLQKKSWNDQSNADIIFFKEIGNKLHFFDAWSLKTTVSLDLSATLDDNKKKEKETEWLALVNVKDDAMSVVLRNFKNNIKTKKVAGRCLLIICNNGTFSSYFWDGKVSNLCKMMKDGEFQVRTDTDKQITFGTKKYKPQCIVCSKRATVPGAKSTSFGRSLQINAAPTMKGRKANFMAEEMVKSGVLEQVVAGSFNCRLAIVTSFKGRLNNIIKEKK